MAIVRVIKHSTAGFSRTHNSEPQYFSIEAGLIHKLLHAFHTPLRWRLAIQAKTTKSKSLCSLLYSLFVRNTWNIIPNSSSQGRPRKESPGEDYGPRSKVCVFHGTQDFTRHPPVNYLPPKGNRQTLSTTQVGTSDPYPSLLPGYFDLGLSCGRYSELNADSVTTSRSTTNSTL